MAKKRQTFKGHTFSVRVPEKTRYGLDLLARKHHAQISALVIRAIDMLFESEGLARKGEGFDVLLDRLWSESESGRVMALAQYAPTFATADEMRMAYLINRACTEYESRGLGDRQAVFARIDQRIDLLRDAATRKVEDESFMDALRAEWGDK